MLMPLKWCGSAVPKGIITRLHVRSSSVDQPLSCNSIDRTGVRLTECPTGSSPRSNCFSLWKIFSLRESVGGKKKILIEILSLFQPAELPGGLLGSPATSPHLRGPRSCLSVVREERAGKEAKNHEVASCSRKTCVRICEK